MSKTSQIEIPFPTADELHLRLAVGACRVRIAPGDGPHWVTGRYTDPTNAVPLRIERTEGTVRLSHEFTWPDTWGNVTEPPTLELTLGKARAYTLTCEGGASESIVDLGGLPLRRLTVKFGAGRQTFDFSAPNPEEMDELTVSAGAAGLEMTHLAHANFAQMQVAGGAAGYELEFGGNLRRDAQVRIQAGMASVELRVPSGSAAKISTETVLGGLEVDDRFVEREGAYWSAAAAAGQTPLITIAAQVAMGQIRVLVDEGERSV